MSTYAYPPPHHPPPYDPYASTYGYPPAPAYAAPAYAPTYDSTTGEEIRTIFITGFPEDVKERELNNMLRFLPGYQASQMNWKNGQAQGFALFDTGAAAASACGVIAHVQFDEASVLRAEIARKNMFVKDDPTAAKRARFSGAYTGSTNASYSVTTAATAAPVAPVAPQGFAQVQNIGDNPPCSTLFIGNLGDTVSEAELQGLFATQPGFKQMKIVRNARTTTAFVEYNDVPSAMAVHSSLQGAILGSSDRGGIRIQYSKNPFGKRKDAPGSEGQYAA